jgi:hypothetical protein
MMDEVQVNQEAIDSAVGNNKVKVKKKRNGRSKLKIMSPSLAASIRKEYEEMGK